MKKLLFTTLVAVSLISSAFASPVKEVNYSITNAFKSSFPKAEKVQWDANQDYVKASFVSDNVNTEAFYTLNGDFIGTSKSITIDQLPTDAKRSFAKKYSGYTVKEAIRFDGEAGTAYYISAENEQRAIILKVANDNIEVFKISAKK